MTQSLTARFSALAFAAAIMFASFVTTVSVPLASGGFA
jgi:hypothetical protein